MSRVLIAGYGFLGEVVARRFVAQGAEVIAVSRSLHPVSAGVQSLRSDLRTADVARDLPTNLSHVVFCAGADAHTETAYREIYVDALDRLIDALRQRSTPWPRILFTSSTAVYEHSSGEWVDEETLATPQRFPGRVMLEAEALMRARAPRGIVLRCAGIYGQGRAGLIDSVRKGTATYSTNLPVYTNRIHKEDCAAAIVTLLRMPSAEGTYIACDNDPAERRELLEWLARALRAPVPRAAEGEAPGRGGNKRCRNARLLATGHGLKFPSFRQGYTHDLELLGSPKILAP